MASYITYVSASAGAEVEPNPRREVPGQPKLPALTLPIFTRTATPPCAIGPRCHITKGKHRNLHVLLREPFDLRGFLGENILVLFEGGLRLFEPLQGLAELGL